MGLSTCFVISVVFTQILIVPVCFGALELTTNATAPTIMSNQFSTKTEADVTVKVDDRVEPTESMELESLHPNPTPTQNLHTPSRMRRSNPISRITNEDELIIGSAVINNEIGNEIKAPHFGGTRTKGKVTQNLGGSVSSGTGNGTGTVSTTVSVMHKLGSPLSSTSRKSNLKSTDKESNVEAETDADAETELIKLSDKISQKRNPHRQSQSHYKQSNSNSNKAVVMGTPRKASNSRNTLPNNLHLNSISQLASPSGPQPQQPHDKFNGEANNKKLRILSLSESVLPLKRNRIRRSSVTQATSTGTRTRDGTETGTETGKTIESHPHPQATLSQVLLQAATAAAAASQKQSPTRKHEENNYSMQQQIKNPIEFQENHFTEPASEALLGSWEDLPWNRNRNTNIRGHESEEDIFKLLSLIGSKEGVNFFPGNPFTDMETESQRNGINSDKNSGHNFNTNTHTNSRHNDANISGGTGNGNANQPAPVPVPAPAPGPAKVLQNKSEHLQQTDERGEYLNSPMKLTFSLPSSSSSSVETQNQRKYEMGKVPADSNNNANLINAKEALYLRDRDRGRAKMLEDEDAYDEDEPAIELSHHGDGFSRPKTTMMVDHNAPVNANKELAIQPVSVVSFPIPMQQMMVPAPRIIQSAALASESPLLLLKSLLPMPPMRQAVLFENEREDKDINEEETPLSIYHHGMWRRRRSGARTQIPIEIDVGMGRGALSRNPNRFEVGTGTGAGTVAGFGELNIIRRAHNSLPGSSSAPDIFEMDGYFSSTPTLKATNSFSQYNNHNNRRFRFRSQNTQNDDRGPSLLSEASHPLSLEISFKPRPRQQQQPAPAPVLAPAPLLWHRHPLSLFDMDFENQKQNPQSSLALTNSDYFLGQLLQKAQQVVDPTLPLYHRFIL